LGSQFQSNPFCELLRDRVLNVPRLVPRFTVWDCVTPFIVALSRTTIQGERKLGVFKTLLYVRCLIALSLRIDGELNDLLRTGEVSDDEVRAEHLARVKRAVVEDLGVYKNHSADVYESVLLPSSQLV
jgi:hypothetical protein